MTSTATLPEEERTSMGDDAWDALLARLNRQSVTKHFEAFVDIDWDDPQLRVDPDDPRFELSPDDQLSKTAWYRSQPPAVRSRLGLERTCSKMKVGLEFEGTLKRGLLDFASRLPNRSPAFRYAYHEVIEEAQHALMFQEFINRSGLNPAGMSRPLALAARRVASLGRTFPTLFFLFVLGGEDPIDFVQRNELRSGRELHPLLERVERLHVGEEARHLSFARQYLKREVPKLGRIRRARLALSAPFIIGTMAAQMLRPSKAIIRRYEIPRSALREAYRHNEHSDRYLADSLRKLTLLCDELDLLTRPARMLWKLNGLGTALDATRSAKRD